MCHFMPNIEMANIWKSYFIIVLKLMQCKYVQRSNYKIMCVEMFEYTLCFLYDGEMCCEMPYQLLRL